MPGLVVRVSVSVGDTVSAGQGLVVVEAMKMENELRASAAGVVTAVLAVPGHVVEKGAVLVELGPPAAG
jgi:pyruvate carboxylase subunit B